MHESGVTEELLQKVLEQADKAGIRKIASIGLALGDRSHITPEAVRLHFEPISRGTCAEGANLLFRVVEGDEDFYLESVEGE